MMHACFYGGGSGSKVTKSVAIIRDLTKTMKAITLKLKGGDGARARARRERSTAEDEDPQVQGTDASSSAKIAPQAEVHGGEKHCHRCCSPLEGGHTAEEEEQGTAPADEAAGKDGDWMAEPEPGVLMTLSPLGDGANYLRRIRFSEEHFPDAQAARAWWEENFDRIAELYSIVVQYEHVEDDDDDPAAPATPCQSEDDEHQRPDDGELGEYSASASAFGGSTSNFSGPSSGSGSGSADKVDSPIFGLVTDLNSSKRSKQAHHNQKTRQEQ